MNALAIPREAVGLKLHRFHPSGSNNCIPCEAVRFVGGVGAVETALRRAQISGRVEIDGKIDDHFADVLDAEQDILTTVALDAKSYSALKNKWMRCKTEPAQ